MPILKQFVSGSSQSKRRSRMDLTREMISAPLGDFRHTMHVGRSGDAFGDTSFLSTRSGEPPREAQAYPHSPRPGLLSRTFRSSKRSQSVTRVDQHDGTLAPSGGSPTYVKNAMSLPFLNDEDGDRVDGGRVPKSLSSSPLKQLNDLDGRPSNGAAGARSPELDERSFGELTDLPGFMQPYGGGMKKAESVMSFHIDLGPSMLGDILGVMEKEDDDLGYEEGRNSEGRASPPLSAHGDGGDGTEVGGEEEDEEEEEEEKEEKEAEDRGEEREEEGVEEKVEEEEAVEVESQQSSERPPSSVDLEQENGGPYTPEYTPELQPKHLHLHLDSCSVSSSGSAAVEDDQPAGQALGGDTESAAFSVPPEEENNFSSFMEDEDDEIRV